MNVVLLSGGSGKRLWPLSNGVRSKQFIKIIDNCDGKLESMVQRVYRQILLSDKNANITIATSKSQIPILRNQLGDKIDISVEPYRKDTFPAIVLACLYLKDIKKVSVDSEVVILPVDPYVDDEYFFKIKELFNIMPSADANIGLIGIKPTYPSEKYGYILPSTFDNSSNTFTVDKFIEKPNKIDAKKFIELGALWNAGVFCFKLKYIIDKAHEIYNFNDYNDLFEKYDTLDEISFDYAIVEKEKKIVGISYSGEWKDIGTWGTLTSVLSKNVIGNAIVDKKSNNSNILNELDIPIIGMGLNNIIVAASPDGIFVSDKDESSYNKQFVDEIGNRPMFEERLWGEFKILDLNSIGTTKSLTKKLFIKSGCSISYQSHKYRDEIWIIIEGEGIFTLDDKKTNVSVGDVLRIKKRQKHSLFGITNLKFIEVQIGEELTEDDIERFT